MGAADAVLASMLTVNGAPTGSGPYTLPITTATAIHTSGDQVSDYPTKTAGHDPMLKTANSLAGPRWRFYPSPDDILVIKTLNSDLMAAKLATATTPPAEYVEQVHVGVHLSNFACQPADLMQFIARCIT